MQREEIEKTLEELFDLSKIVSKSEQQKILDILQKYCEDKRVYNKVLTYHLQNTIEFLTLLNFSKLEMITAIKNGPTIIHANKKDLLAKYLLLASLKETKSSEVVRKDLLINYPKYYVIGISTMYARMKYLAKLGEKSITKWHVMKMTNKEFENRFGFSQEKLIENYPYDETKMDELLNLPGNEKIKANLKEM